MIDFATDLVPTTTGTITTIGTALSATARGVTSSSTTRNRIVTKLIATPSTTPSMRPTSALVPVSRLFSIR